MSVFQDERERRDKDWRKDYKSSSYLAVMKKRGERFEYIGAAAKGEDSDVRLEAELTEGTYVARVDV